MTQTLARTLEDAIAHHRAGRLSDAENLYRAALRSEPQHAGANHNLALITFQRGEGQASLDHFKRALSSDPGQPLYWLSYARALLAVGHQAEATSVLRQARLRGVSGPGIEALERQAGISGAPQDPVSLFQAALRAHEAGKLDEAVPLYRKVIAIKPDQAEPYGNLANVLCTMGEAVEAEAVIRKGMEISPGNADLEFNLGYVMAAQGRYDDAIAAYRRAVALRPDMADAHYHLGSLLTEHGSVSEGFQHLMRRAELVYGTGKAPPRSKPAPLHKIKHDREQRDYLAGGKAPPDAPEVDDMFHLGDGARIAGSTINQANATPEMMAEWRDAWPQMVVLEDFLVPEALERLRDYCARSTIWRRIYAAGYIGATPPDGFACPLLAQIAEDIVATWPEIFGPHHFAYLGAFKYDSELSTGTNIHADFSAVNVNFYIAPDEANLDPESGGMKIWDVAVDNEADMRRFNSDEAAVTAYLKANDAKAFIVPHRANRAVIFKSSLIHKTDDCHFAEGYLNKRINVSLLFGKYSAPT